VGRVEVRVEAAGVRPMGIRVGVYAGLYL